MLNYSPGRPFGRRDRRRAHDPGAVVEDDRLPGRDAADPVTEPDADGGRGPWCGPGIRGDSPCPVGDDLGGCRHLLSVRAHLRADTHDARRGRPAPPQVLPLEDVDPEPTAPVETAIGAGE